MTKKEKIMNNANYQLRLSPELRETFKKMANDNGEVMSSTLRGLIKEYIKKHKK